jgi:hypothetical protein
MGLNIIEDVLGYLHCDLGHKSSLWKSILGASWQGAFLQHGPKNTPGLLIAFHGGR